MVAPLLHQRRPHLWSAVAGVSVKRRSSPSSVPSPSVAIDRSGSHGCHSDAPSPKPGFLGETIPPRPAREKRRYRLVVVRRRSRSEARKLPQWLPQAQLQLLRFSRCPSDRGERNRLNRTRRPSAAAYAAAVFPVMIAELFPTRVRSTALGAPHGGCGRGRCWHCRSAGPGHI